MHYFGGKDRLFAAVMRLPDDLVENAVRLAAQGRDGLGERLVRFFLGMWEDPVTQGPMLALVRSAVANEQAAATLRGFVSDALLGRVAATLQVSDQRLRAALAGSQLVGLATLRYAVKVEPLASADVETVVAWLAPPCSDTSPRAVGLRAAAGDEVQLHAFDHGLGAAADLELAVDRRVHGSGRSWSKKSCEPICALVMGVASSRRICSSRSDRSRRRRSYSPGA